jgi:hypothetical protein
MPPAVTEALERLSALSMRLPAPAPQPVVAPAPPAPPASPPKEQPAHARQERSMAAVVPPRTIGSIEVTITPPAPPPPPPAPPQQPVVVAPPPTAPPGRLSRLSAGYGFGQG